MFPEKRLIVFAGAQSELTARALLACQADALLCSFWEISRSSRWDKRIRPILDEWPQYRYLDSGVYTLMRKYGAVDRSAKSQPKAASAKAVERKADPTLPYQLVKDYIARYLRYLEEHLDTWDFVVEMDLDKFRIVRDDGKWIPGVAVADWSRDQIKRIVGDRLIVVWHPEVDPPPYPRWNAMLRDYKYVAIPGQDAIKLRRRSRYLADQARQAHVYSHYLGTSLPSVLEQTTFDSFDSTTWLNCVRFGAYGQFMYRRDVPMSTREVSKSRFFEEKVRSWGYDPKVLLEPGGSQQAKFEVAIKVFLERQELANQNRPILAHSPLPLNWSTS
jgi:hypothetical protein